MPIRIPLFVMGSLVGCRDEALLARHAKSIRKALEEIDEQLEECDDSAVDPSFIEEARSSKPLPDTDRERLQSTIDSLKSRLLKGEKVDMDLDVFMDDVVKTFQTPKSESASAVQPAVVSDSPLPSAHEILRHIFMSEPVDARAGFAYDMVIQAMCQKSGVKLPNQNWIDVKHIDDWGKELDRCLGAYGISADLLSVSGHLLSRGNPFFRSYSSDAPFIGYLRNEEIGPICAALDSLDLKDKGPEDPETYLLDIRKWLRACLREEEDFICFIR